MKRVESIQALGPLQQGMVYHVAAGGPPGEHLVQFVLTFDDIDPALLRAAWEALLAAHGALRTGFSWEAAGKSLAVVMAGVKLPWAEADWRTLSPDDFSERLARYLDEDRARGFELTRAPLMRLLLARETDRRWRLVFAYHHLLMDGWSAALLFDELAARYGALIAGEPPAVPERAPYADFLAWHAAQDLTVAEAWWRAYLEEAPATGLPLATGSRPRRMRELPARLEVDIWARLRAACRTLGVTPATATAGAWALLLARAQGEADVLFGATLSGRPESLAGAEAMIGLFINTVPIRARPHEALPLGTFLTHLQADMSEAREHGHVPLARIQGLAGPARAAFETLFVYENYPPAHATTASALGIVETASYEETSYPGSLILEPDGDTLSIAFKYDGGRISDSDAALLIGRYVRLLEAIATAAPGARLCDLDHLTPRDETAQRTPRATLTPADPPLLPALFATAADAHPDATALIHGAEAISYAALRDRAVAIAEALAASGVAPGSVVGIALPRDPDLLAALLGTLLAGCAYLPIDLEQVPARTAAVAATLGLATTICVAATAPLGAGGATLRLDQPLPPGRGPLPEIRPDGIAYVIATSGSTGVPKLVGIEHRALAAFLAWARGAYAPEAFARVAATTPVTFDVSVFELFAPLACGGTVLLLDDISALGPDAAPSLVSGVPSLLAAFDPPASARAVNLAGEALPQPLADRLTADPGRMVRNLYGPTEATVYATLAELRAGEAVTIGHPLPHVAAYVLGAGLRPAGIGELGELYLAGPALAHGYLGAPGATARAFLPDPFGPARARMYRTGDRVRLLEDGSIAFAGRRDAQIKLNGVRVELGEIDAALAVAGFGADEAAVVVIPASDGRQRLVACVTRDVTVDTLNAALAARLPAALRPQTVCRVEALPRTRSGKLDRRTLAARAATAVSQVAPSSGDYRDDTEAAIARAIAGALGLARVGPEDDFLALGGDSIVGLQAAAAARKAGLALHPKHFVTLRTPRAIASAIGDAIDAAEGVGGESGDWPLGAIQQRFFAEKRADPSHFNQALLLTLEADTDLAALQAALAATEAVHPALRFRYRQDGDAIRQWVAAPTEVPIERIDLAGIAEPGRSETITAIGSRVQASLDIGAGPTFRAVHFDPGPDRNAWLLLVAHHLCVDGVSWRILLDDIGAGYAQARAGMAIRLPAEPTRFADWARAARDHARSPECDWAHWLAVARTEAAPIPCDSDGEHRTGAEALATRSLTAPETQRLLRRAPGRHGAGINALLLGALARVLTRWAGGPVVIDLEGHGREDLGGGLDLARTVGWFTSLFPVLVDIDAEATLDQAVTAAARALDRPDAGAGYGMLRYLSGDPRAEALAKAEGQILFNYLGQLDGIVSAPPIAGWAAESAGSDEAPGERRSHLIDVNAQVTDGALKIAWCYSPGRHNAATIARLADAHLAALRALAGAETDQPRPTVAGISDEARARLMARIAERQPQGTA